MWEYWHSSMTLTEAEIKKVVKLRKRLSLEPSTYLGFMVERREASEFRVYVDLIDLIFLFHDEVINFNKTGENAESFARYYLATHKIMEDPLKRDDPRWIEIIAPMIDVIKKEGEKAFIDKTNQNIFKGNVARLDLLATAAAQHVT